MKDQRIIIFRGNDFASRMFNSISLLQIYCITKDKFDFFFFNIAKCKRKPEIVKVENIISASLGRTSPLIFRNEILNYYLLALPRTVADSVITYVWNGILLATCGTRFTELICY
ncbi:hypothetical protein PUN28_010104 [Cardiocondyla obscurior]|uniref:Uncharacterized protein n=1 Tax=Cardiocondyla obscurior TaxID=286306 RepID=A0AAW2FPH3_9HYME